ncbi:MAG: sodium:solute symporter [Cyclonatronaceae bacterium]
MESTLHIVDYLVLATYLLFIVIFGVSFAWKQKSTNHYFAASGGLPSWAVGLSILATLISSVTFLAYPGAGYNSNWILLVQGLMVPIVLIFLVNFIVPLYRKVIGISTYEYFEKRFGYIARLYTSFAFTMAHFSKMGTVFFLLALALASMAGLNIYMVIIVLGVIIILYTLLGGIEAVIWLDVIQGIMLFLGGVMCLIVMFVVAPANMFEMIGHAWEMDKIGFGPYDWDFTKLTFIVIALNGIFYAIQKYGTDQTIVQRYLTARSHKEAVKASLVGVLLCVPVWTLFMFIGSMLFSFYELSEFAVPEGTRPDAVFPYFITTQLPIGVTGLILAALSAAALSSLDSDLNSLAAVGVEDYYKRLKPDRTDKHYLLVGRMIVVGCGIAALGVAFMYVQAEGETVLGIVFALYAIFSGGIAGLFLLGVFTKRANKQGVTVGIIACILFTGWAMLTSVNIGPGGKPFLDLGNYNYTHHSYMLGVYTHFILFGVSYLASFMFPAHSADDSLTIYGYWKDNKALRDNVSNTQ